MCILHVTYFENKSYGDWKDYDNMYIFWDRVQLHYEKVNKVSVHSTTNLLMQGFSHKPCPTYLVHIKPVQQYYVMRMSSNAVADNLPEVFTASCQYDFVAMETLSIYSKNHVTVFIIQKQGPNVFW